MARAAAPKARPPAAPKPPRVSVEYESMDIPPRYVEGVQGMATPKGAVQIYFFSDYILPPPAGPGARAAIAGADAEGMTLDIRIEDPYGVQSGQLRVVRRVEANLVLSLAAVQDLHNWTGQFLQKAAEQAAPSHPPQPA